MSQQKLNNAHWSELSLLSSFYAKVSVLGEQMDKLDYKVNLLFNEIKKMHLQLKDMARTIKIESKNKWIPDKSYMKEYDIDFDKFIKNVEELNLIACFEEQQIQHTPNGASFKSKERIPLIIYANGIILANGRLKLYSDEDTLSFIEDVMDGYFPAELQHQHPEGVVFQVSDKRNEVGGKEKKFSIKKRISMPSSKATAKTQKEEDYLNDGFQSLQDKFPKGQNEINVKILLENGNKTCTLQVSSTEIKVGYLLRQLANGENARLLVGYPSKPLTDWNDSILDVLSTPTLADCGITENCLLRLQVLQR